MTENNDLFPFPFSNEAEKPADNTDSTLPAFPESVSDKHANEKKPDQQSDLSPTEVSEIRKILDLYRNGRLGGNTPVSHDSVPSLEPAKLFTEIPGSIPEKIVAKLPPEDNSRADLIQVFDATYCPDPIENDNKALFKGILAEITDSRTRLRAFASLAGLFPIKKCLRHGTPEQRLFTLIALGDRFLENMAGMAFAERKKLIKAVARFLSQIAENFNFIQMEGEAFSSQYHERVAGASSAGKTVREMHGFLVVGKDNNQVVRVGQVLT